MFLWAALLALWILQSQAAFYESLDELPQRKYDFIVIGGNSIPCRIVPLFIFFTRSWYRWQCGCEQAV
jgi:hypothetical protein